MKCILYILLACVFSISLHGETDFDSLMGKTTKHWSHISQEADIAFLNSVKENYEKNWNEQFRAEGAYKIPKVVHFIWLGPKHFPPQSVENVRTWIAQNPEWKLKFWTDRPRQPPCEGMETHYVSDFKFTKLKRCYHDSENWAEKSDILRYEILLQEGGVYADHDANCLKPFDGLHKGYDFYCGLEAPHEPFVGRNITCGNGVIGSRPDHPTVAKVIDIIAERWDELKFKYRGRDLYSKVEIVMQRTYIALTHALLETINQNGNVDIALPSAYFFAKSGIPSLYSKHFYATAWDDFHTKKSEGEQIRDKNLSKLSHETHKMTLLLTLLIGFNLLFVAVMVKFLLKKRSC